jgi:hypothetical protein
MEVRAWLRGGYALLRSAELADQKTCVSVPMIIDIQLTL